jgi:hypothetical protein
MKQIIFMLCLIALTTGCNNADKENQANMERQYEADLIAENSKDTISELPLGFKFGMTKEAADKNIEGLMESGTITHSYDNCYNYKYILESGLVVPTELQVGFYNDSLYVLCFSFSESQYNEGFKIDDELISAIDKDISNKVDTTYKRISYYENLKDHRFVFTKWYKGNQYIFLRSSVFCDIQFINAPTYRKVMDAENKNAIDKAEKKAGVKVENSAWDGSVQQVKKYLKSTLKDPDSYESIEWSDVKETEDGYTVRHKYRAKNSLGGYVVENQIFYLDFQGNVTNVLPY